MPCLALSSCLRSVVLVLVLHVFLPVAGGGVRSFVRSCCAPWSLPSFCGNFERVTLARLLHLHLLYCTATLYMIKPPGQILVLGTYHICFGTSGGHAVHHFHTRSIEADWHSEYNIKCVIMCFLAVLYVSGYFLVWCQRYPSVETTELLGSDGLDGVGETRPCVLCEYSHAMGNSNGNLHKYWEVPAMLFWSALSGRPCLVLFGGVPRSLLETCC